MCLMVSPRPLCFTTWAPFGYSETTVDIKKRAVYYPPSILASSRTDQGHRNTWVQFIQVHLAQCFARVLRFDALRSRSIKHHAANTEKREQSSWHGYQLRMAKTNLITCQRNLPGPLITCPVSRRPDQSRTLPAPPGRSMGTPLCPSSA